MTPDRPTAQRTTDRILNGTSAAFDWLDAHWNSTATRRATGTVLVTIFVAVLAAAEIARRGWLPESALRFAPRSHFVAVSLVFSFLLVLEWRDSSSPWRNPSPRPSASSSNCSR